MMQAGLLSIQTSTCFLKLNVKLAKTVQIELSFARNTIVV
jgi:hypothetical protein